MVGQHGHAWLRRTTCCCVNGNDSRHKGDSFRSRKTTQRHLCISKPAQGLCWAPRWGDRLLTWIPKQGRKGQYAKRRSDFCLSTHNDHTHLLLPYHNLGHPDNALSSTIGHPLRATSKSETTRREALHLHLAAPAFSTSLHAHACRLRSSRHRLSPKPTLFLHATLFFSEELPP